MQPPSAASCFLDLHSLRCRRSVMLPSIDVHLRDASWVEIDGSMPTLRHGHFSGREPCEHLFPSYPAFSQEMEWRTTSSSPGKETTIIQPGPRMSEGPTVQWLSYPFLIPPDRVERNQQCISAFICPPGLSPPQWT